MARKLTFEIFRFNPERPDIPPRMQAYQIEEVEGLSLFLALNRIREEQDPTLKFDFVCRAAICGTCAMLINGRPGLACKTLTATLPDTVALHPLPVFRMLGDLTVDTGTWFRRMVERTHSWIHTDKPFDPHAPEKRMDNTTANAIYELERCIECGCCIAGCGTINIREDFTGAAGLLRVARFMIDPRDERKAGSYLDIVGTDEGVFGCMGLMACEDLCPKGIPLQIQLAYVRRALTRAAIGGKT